MKKVLWFLALLLMVPSSWAQEQEEESLYLDFSFMRVDNDQQMAYQEVEEFWEKIHVERIKQGNCIGWDLWSLEPSGEDQDFQYLTVSLYNDPVKMMEVDDYWAALEAAYPELTTVEQDKKMEETTKSRDVAVRVFLDEVAQTSADDFDMPIGTLAILNFMKAKPGQVWDYEKAEQEVFQPMHQQQIDAGGRGSWGVLRNMLWYASDIYATHITFDMFTGYDQFFNGADGGDGTPMTEEQQQAYNDGLATRDLRMIKHARLIRKVRPE